MSLDLAQKALELFDDDLDITPSSSSSSSKRQSKSEKKKLSKQQVAPTTTSPDVEEIAAARAEQLLRSTLVSRLKTPKILDKVIRQQKNRSSHETRRLDSVNPIRKRTSPGVIASSAVKTKAKKKADKKKTAAKEEQQKSVFSEEDFQNFFQTYKPTKPQ